MSNYKIVKTDVNYTYALLESDIKKLSVEFPFLEQGTIGNSVLGKNLYYLRIGNGNNNVFINATHHSLEWITSVVLMKFIEDFCRSYKNNTNISNYNLKDIWNSSSIYIVPMVNPDGVDLVLNGLDNIEDSYKENLIRWNDNSLDFSNKWQANIRGVDLNHNYDASWDEYLECQKEYSIEGPRYTRYSGEYPESEAESKAVADFTRNKCFDLVLALHSQGKEIYWDYNNMATSQSKNIGERFAKSSGYLLTSPGGVASFTGYKDWFIDQYKKPGFTIEVGKGKNPLPISQFDEIYSDLLELLLISSTATI